MFIVLLILSGTYILCALFLHGSQTIPYSLYSQHVLSIESDTVPGVLTGGGCRQCPMSKDHRPTFRGTSILPRVSRNDHFYRGSWLCLWNTMTDQCGLISLVILTVLHTETFQAVGKSNKIPNLTRPPHILRVLTNHIL